MRQRQEVQEMPRGAKRKHRVTWRYPMFSGGEKNRYLNFYCLIGSGAFALKFKPPIFIFTVLSGVRPPGKQCSWFFKEFADQPTGGCEFLSPSFPAAF
jgi:hypothetical protein